MRLTRLRSSDRELFQRAEYENKHFKESSGLGAETIIAVITGVLMPGRIRFKIV